MNENNKRVDLTGILYDEKGEFIPQTASHGNVNGDLAYLRNTYMEAEREYFETLLAIPEIREKFMEYLDCSSDYLFAEATRIQDKLENGELETKEDIERMKSMSSEEKDLYHLKRLEYAEGLMCLLFAAARDKVFILTLVHVPSGRSR